MLLNIYIALKTLWGALAASPEFIKLGYYLINAIRKAAENHDYKSVTKKAARAIKDGDADLLNKLTTGMFTDKSREAIFREVEGPKR